MQPDERLTEAARVIYGVCFTAAPITFDEAKRRGALPYRRAIEAAGKVCDRLGCPAREGA